MSSSAAALKLVADNEVPAPAVPSLQTDVSDFSQKHILVVDDDPTIRDMIVSFINLLSVGHVSTAENGQEALGLAEVLMPDLIICDVIMPRMDGQEFLERVREMPAFEETPVLMVTGAEDAAIRNKLLAAGATNVISKPIDGSVVLERTRLALEHQSMVASLRAYQQKTAAEFMAARAIQAELMPTFTQMRRVEKSFNVTMDAAYQPCDDLGGDIWGFRKIDDRRIMFYLADFAGHGLAASLNTFRLHTLISRIVEMDLSPSEAMARLNTELCAVLPRGQFAAMFMGLLDLCSGTMKYSNAAVPEPLFGSRDHQELEIGNSKGVPLGLKAGATYREWKVPFPAGSFMIVYSDALIEQEMAAGPLGTEGLRDFITPLMKKLPASRLLEGTVSEWNAQCTSDLADDLSAFFLMRD